MTDPTNAPPGGALAAALGAVVLILAVVTVWQSGDNRGLQQTIADNQPRLAKTQTIASLDNNLIQLLAKSAVDDKDDALRELLRANGVTLKQSAAPQQQVVGNAQ